MPDDPMGQLALYSGMDNLTLFEINDQLDALLTSAKRKTYEFEMELQAPLLEMSLNGVKVDQGKRTALIREHETELQKTHEILHQYCEAIGYYKYYLTQGLLRIHWATNIPMDELPRSWEEWTMRPVQWRRRVKALDPKATAEYHKALKSFGPPYTPGDKNSAAFNAQSPVQKLRLLYDFFGHAGNTISQSLSPEFPPPWNQTRGIKEIRTRDIKGEYTPSADRECLEKIQSRGMDFDHKDAHFWTLPFVNCCLEIMDLGKTLGFLRCRLEDGYFKSSFAAATVTGRLASRENAQGYGSNAQNITARLRVILEAEKNWKLGAFDYEQIESRIVGAICYRLFGATAYLNATESGDLHTLVCSMVWEDKLWPQDFTLANLERHGPFPKEMIKAAKAIAKGELYRGKSMRDGSKTLGHGSNYLGQPRHMAKQSHIPFPLVEHFQEMYFGAFPELRRWHQWVAEQVQTIGEITTMLGRVRKFFGRPNEDKTIRDAVAYEPQSVAADYTNNALLDLYKASKQDLPIKVFLQKHDEIGFRFREADEELTIPRIISIMERHITIKNPAGEPRDWYVPAEAMVGWNLGYRSDSNPDGLIVRAGPDERTREHDSSNLLKRTF